MEICRYCKKRILLTKHSTATYVDKETGEFKHYHLECWYKRDEKETESPTPLGFWEKPKQ